MAKNHTPNGNIIKSDAQDKTQLTAGGKPTAGEFNAGDLIGGSYQVLRWIGAGGMGNVYSVKHTIMQTEYALKTLSADKVTEVAWRRFQNEAQAIARMNHPNIVAIYNLGLHEGRLPYYVMDLLQGKSLLDLLKDNGPMEVNKALSLFIELAAGFGYAHKKGIVHRDIKPPNIVLLDAPEASCRVKIVDFGIAKLSGVKDPENQFLTGVGEVCGSPYYMSPEQTIGGRIDARSDIYSLGCTLFEVLTGAPPLRGRNAMDTMLMHQTTVPPTLKAASGGNEFPEMLEQVMATLLAKEPMDRYQTMELLAQDLSTIIAGNQAAVNPYTGHSPISAGAREPAGRSGHEGELPTRRQYGEAENEEEPSSRPLILTVCALMAVIITMVGVGFWWQNQSKPRTPTVVAAPAIGNDDLAAIDAGVAEIPAANRYIGRETDNNNAKVTSIKDTKPFCSIENINGEWLKVFDFPTDITIGDIRSATLKEQLARGRRTFPAREEVIFTPDAILLRYPAYLSRFRPHDIYGIEMEGKLANDELFKLTYKMAGVCKVQLENCPNITDKIFPLIDKMPTLTDLEIGKQTPSLDAISHLNCLRRLKAVGFLSQPEAESFLSLIKGSTATQTLCLNHSTLSHKAFEYITSLPNLGILSFEDATFAQADLKTLAKLPKLSAIYMVDCKVDGATIINLKKIKTLRYLNLTEPDSQSLLSANQIASELRGVTVVFKPNINDSLPISSQSDQ